MSNPSKTQGTAGKFLKLPGSAFTCLFPADWSRPCPGNTLGQSAAQRGMGIVNTYVNVCIYMNIICVKNELFDTICASSIFLPPIENF